MISNTSEREKKRGEEKRRKENIEVKGNRCYADP